MAKSFVTLYKWLVPGWLLAGDGDGVLRSISQWLDESAQRVRDGITRRFPSYAAAAGDDAALAKLGKDRGIQRGRAETPEHYAARLVEWRYPRGHRVRGSAFALLAQVSEYFGAVTCWTIDAKGTYHRHGLDGAESFSYHNAWVWDALPASDWARFWLFVEGHAFAAAHVGTVPTGASIGQTGIVYDDVVALRRLMAGRAWRPAGTQPMWLVLSLSDPAVFPDPNVEWANWAEPIWGQLARQGAGLRFISLDPTFTSMYAGNPAWFELSAEVGGGGYAGNPAMFPLLTTLPDGTAYAGDPDSFPTIVQLIDDGDPVP